MPVWTDAFSFALWKYWQVLGDPTEDHFGPAKENLRFNNGIGKCSTIWPFLDRTDQRLPLPCQIGRHEHGRCDQMHKYAQFECYAKINWEPVQTSQRRSDVFSCSDASNKSGGRVMGTLQWINWGLGACCQNGVAVIRSWCHKSRYQTRRDIGTEDSTDGFKAAKMEADTNDGADMVFHGIVRCLSRLQDREPHWPAWWCLVRCM